MTDLKFHSQDYLYYLFALLPLVGLALWAFWYRSSRLRRFASSKEARDRLMPLRVGRKRLWRDALFLVGSSLVLVALARPQRLLNASKQDDTKGIELIFCVDVSNSMLSQDVAPNRLDYVKQTLLRVLSRSAGNQVGIVAFAGEAFVQLPLTTDLKSAVEFLQDLSTEMTSAQGTDIGAALELSRKSFSSRTDIGKAIVLLTDGEDHEDDALTRARGLGDDHIRLLVVGVGTPEGGTIPTPDGDLLDEEGRPVVTRFSEEACRALASASGGSFISMRDSRQLAGAIENDLVRVPRAGTGSSGLASYEELYAPVLAVALALLTLEFFVSERRNLFLLRRKLFRLRER